MSASPVIISVGSEWGEMEEDPICCAVPAGPASLLLAWLLLGLGLTASLLLFTAVEAGKAKRRMEQGELSVSPSPAVSHQSSLSSSVQPVGPYVKIPASYPWPEIAEEETISPGSHLTPPKKASVSRTKSQRQADMLWEVIHGVRKKEVGWPAKVSVCGRY